MAQILVIEEGSAKKARLVRELRADAYDVESAEDRAVGLALAAANPPKAIVLVGIRPDSVGLELCSTLCKLCPAAPILGLTPSENSHARTDILDAGATDCLSIPYSMQEFKSRLRVRFRIIASLY